MRRRALRRVRALSAGAILLALLVAVVVTARREGAGTRSDPITRPAPELDPTAQVLLPGLVDARVVVPDRPHAPDELRGEGEIRRTRSFSVRTNRHGLRGPEIALPAPGPRVLAVGDSVTFGWGVEEEQSWPARLADELGVEVLNAGVPAQRPPAIAAWTAAYAPGLDVDLVLLARRPDPREADPVGSYAAAVARVRGALPGVPLGVILPPLSTFDPEGIARGPAEVEALRAALGGVPLLDLTPAFREAAPERGVILELAGGLQRMVLLPGRTVLHEAKAPARGLAPALRDAFEEDSTIREALFFDDGHPDAEGFRVFGAEVARWVRAQGWLGGAPPPTTGAAPLIPATDPAWAREPPEFVEDPAFYGEASWDDVRGRVIQHQATALRDRARLAAARGDLGLAARRYAEAVGWMEAHPVAGGTGAELHARYLAALRRDAALASALAEGRAPPVPAAGLARLRALLLAGADRPTLSREAAALELAPLDPRAFGDFEGRHRLRLALVDAALDALDPFALPELWGGWEPTGREEVRRALLAALDGPAELPRWARPARHLARAPARFTAEGLGALPTGDSWVDTGGEPGPAAIGRLEVLSLEDPAHRAWLEAEAARLQAALERDPSTVAAALEPTLAALRAQPYTSRYYNLKQARNEAVRQLARAGAFREAALLLEGAFPLHGQDRAAPNRAGVLRGIQGRLLGLAGDPAADATLARAIGDGEAFLASIDRAERR